MSYPIPADLKATREASAALEARTAELRTRQRELLDRAKAIRAQQADEQAATHTARDRLAVQLLAQARGEPADVDGAKATLREAVNRLADGHTDAELQAVEAAVQGVEGDLQDLHKQSAQHAEAERRGTLGHCEVMAAELVKDHAAALKALAVVRAKLHVLSGIAEANGQGANRYIGALSLSVAVSSAGPGWQDHPNTTIQTGALVDSVRGDLLRELRAAGFKA